MAGKKMFPPREVADNLGKSYDELKLQIGFRIPVGHIVMRFSDHVEWVRMSSAGARKLAAMFIEKANEQDRLGTEGKSR